MTEEIAEYVRHSSRRVKLYALNEERLWEDQGTGHVVYHIDECKSTSLIVRSEIDGTGDLFIFSSHYSETCF